LSSQPQRVPRHNIYIIDNAQLFSQLAAELVSLKSKSPAKGPGSA
jgi:hypothetical protein